MAWFSLAKIALQAGGKIYANRQKAKVAMSDAQLLHAERQARGEEAYQGKLLEARQSDYKDEFVLVIISAPIIVLMWAVMSDDPAAMEKVKLFLSTSSRSLHGSQTCGFWLSRAFLELRELKSLGTVAKNNGWNRNS